MKRRPRKPPPAKLVVHILVPVKDREGVDYPKPVFARLHAELEARFHGWSILGDRPLMGAWVNPESGQVEYDESLRYELAVPSDRLDELDDFVARFTFEIGQRALFRVVYFGGEGRVILARGPEGQE